MTKTNPSTQTYNEPLQYLCSVRCRLDEQQRLALRNAYELVRRNNQPQQGARIGGSTVTTVTAIENVHQELGLNSYLMSDLLNSRDSIALPLLIKIQKALKVTVVTPEDINEAFKGYTEAMFNV
jgi:hypothetical protein